MVSPHPRKKNKRRKNKYSSKNGWIRRLSTVLFRMMLGFLVISFLFVLTLRWLNPPVSMMMILQRYDAAMNHRKDFRIDYRWVDWEQIAVHVPLAMMAAEDQKFATHHGFDFESIADAVEAYFTALIEMLWRKQRILEVYMNIVELGDVIYGVEAASRHFFKKPAGKIGLEEAVRLAAVLPNPRVMNPGHPSSHVLKRARWIRRQISQLGGRRMLSHIAGSRLR